MLHDPGIQARINDRIEHTKTNTLPLLDHKGKYRTSSLFDETYRFGKLDPEIYVPKWTLNERPKSISPGSVFYGRAGGGTNILPSFRQLYLEASDPTEFNFAMGTLGSWEHWQRLCKSGFLKKLIEDWRATVRVKIEAEAIEAARAIAKGPTGPTALQAAKWLHSKVSKDTGPGRGRPSKDQVRQEVLRQTEEELNVRRDHERIKGRVNGTSSS